MQFSPEAQSGLLRVSSSYSRNGRSVSLGFAAGRLVFPPFLLTCPPELQRKDEILQSFQLVLWKHCQQGQKRATNLLPNAFPKIAERNSWKAGQAGCKQRSCSVLFPLDLELQVLKALSEGKETAT